MDLLDRFSGVVPVGGGWKALCPCHRDLHPSLSINRGEGGGWVLYCHSCGRDATGAVLAQGGLTWADLRGDGRPAAPRPSAPPVTSSEADLRDRAYRVFLGELGLSYDHKAHLQSRGLLEAHIWAH